ncbi:MAG: hypothetical protein WBW34_00230 [Nitrososphaeraceae archaeon]
MQDISKTRTARQPKCESEEFPSLGHPNLKCIAITYRDEVSFIDSPQERGRLYLSIVYYSTLTYCNHMIELFSSVVSYLLSGLRVHQAEKYAKQSKEEATHPFGKTVTGPF